MWAAILLIAAIGYALRAIAVVGTTVDHPIRADAAEYYITAYNLAKNGVYTMSDAQIQDPAATLKPDAFRWPGLPLLIATLMWQWPDHPLIVREMEWFNVAAGTGTIILLGSAAAAALPVWAALAATVLTAVSPHLISFTVYMLTETPTALLVALVLWMCVVAQACAAQHRRYALIALGLTLGLLALVRPVYAGFAPFLALAAPAGERRTCLVLVLAGMVLPLAPWLIRNALTVAPGTAPSYLGMTLVSGGYPGYMLNGDPKTFPFPFAHDPGYPAATATLATAIAEIARRIAADPLGMARWYLVGKPPYLWQFSNIDGAGDVFIYPVLASPFHGNAVFELLHAIMRALHSPIVLLGALGSLLVWLPRLAPLLPERNAFALRATSLLPVFLTAVMLPLDDPVRYAVPIFPALFVVAMVPLVVAGRALARGSPA